MRKVLVTGNCGYLGSQLTHLLLNQGDNEVLGIDTLMFNQELVMSQFMGHPNFRFEMVDVRDYSTMAHFVQWADVVIPLAALVGAPLCDTAPVLASQVNRDSILWLVKNLSPNQRIIFPQTNSGYGTSEEICTENSPLNPLSHYAKTKTEAEKAVLDHPDSVSMRLATVFGCSPRMRLDLMVNDFTDRLSHGEALTVYEPKAMRNYVHVRDVARAFLFFTQTTYKGAFNVGSPEDNMSKLGLAKLVCETLAMDPESYVRVGEGEDPDKRNYTVCNKKVVRAGFEFKFRLRDGIREVGEFVRYLTPPARKRMRNV